MLCSDPVELDGELTGFGDGRLLFRLAHLDDVRHTESPCQMGRDHATQRRDSPAYEWTLA
ncbi:hypothetical protein D3C83_137840 [compost metagenome]